MFRSLIVFLVHFIIEAIFLSTTLFKSMSESAESAMLCNMSEPDDVFELRSCKGPFGLTRRMWLDASAEERAIVNGPKWLKDGLSELDLPVDVDSRIHFRFSFWVQTMAVGWVFNIMVNKSQCKCAQNVVCLHMVDNLMSFMMRSLIRLSELFW